MSTYFIFLLAAYIGGNVYIFVRGLLVLQHFPLIIKWLFGGLYWFSVLSLLLSFALRKSNIASTTGIHIFYEYSCSWLVFTLYMTLFLLLFDGYRFFNPAFRYGFISALTLTLSLLLYGNYRYQHPVRRIIDVDINKSLTDHTSSLKIVAVSDIHLGLGTNKKRLQKYIDIINAENPDIILIAGDLIDNSLVPVQHQQMEEELWQLRARYGIYMSPGNHEYISGIAECQEYISNMTPIHFLRDTFETLSNGIQIVGRDDRQNASRKELHTLLYNVDRNQPVIVLDHQPYQLKEAENESVDILFCGHTHDGQVWPMSWITKRLFDLSHGFEKRMNTFIYVSSGLSLWGPPFRIGTDSELIVFNVRFIN